MRLDPYIKVERIVDLESSTFEDAIKEMLALCDPDVFTEAYDIQKTYEDLIKREENMTTCLSSGVAIPHVRMPLKKSYVFVLGRCKNGLDYEGVEDYKRLRFVFLLLASDKDKAYLNVLASLARIFQDKSLVQFLFNSVSLQVLRKHVLKSFKGVFARASTRISKQNFFIIKEAERVAKIMRSSAIMLFGNTFTGHFSLPESLKAFKTILVTQSNADQPKIKDIVDQTIVVRSYSNNRLSQLRSAVLIGLTRGFIHYSDKICCVGGIAQTNQLDSIVIVDVEREFQAVLSKKKSILPEHIKPEVLERVLDIANELSLEGREGRSVGTFFVIGDTKELNPFVKPLILNPFYGYKEEDRNILNPFMDETIKEFSSLDGAFIVRGDGVLESAGSLIHAPNYYKELPSGLGTKHAAAVAISIAAKCIAITVSASTGQITLFKKGEMLPLHDHK